MKIPAMPETEIVCSEGVVIIRQIANYTTSAITFPIELWVTIKDMVEEAIVNEVS